MPKMLAFIDGSIYSDSVCDHVIWAAAGDEFDVSLFNVIEGFTLPGAPQIFLAILAQRPRANCWSSFQN